MSSLSAGLAQMKKQQKNAEVLPRFRVNQQTAATPSSAVSSPGYSQAGTDEPPRKKIKPAQMSHYDEGTGNHMLSQMQYSLEYLKRNLEGKTEQELENYLSKTITPALRHVLRRNERISYDPETHLYRFQPIYNVRNAPQLLALLDAQTASHGLIVKDLKEGWPNCLEELDRLEKEGHILLIRNRKDDRPKTVWPSSFKDATVVDKEFVDIYLDAKIPGRDQLPRELESLGLKPTSVDPMTVVHKKPGDASKQKKPKTRRHKVTNTHMGQLKDLGLRNPKK